MRNTTRHGSVLCLTAVLAGLSCGTDATDPGEVVLTMQTHTMGCPVVGELWSATIRAHAGPVYTLAGTWISPDDPGNGRCFEPRLPGFDCVFEVPFETRVLGALEIDALHAIIDDFPSLQAEIDGACDPCGQTTYSWGNRTVSTVCTIEPDPAYFDALTDLYSFLKAAALPAASPR